MIASSSSLTNVEQVPLDGLCRWQIRLAGLDPSSVAAANCSWIELAYVVLIGLASVESECVVAESGTFAEEILLIDDSVGDLRRKAPGVKCKLSGTFLPFRWFKEGNLESGASLMRRGRW